MKNERVAVEINKQPGCQVELKITLFPRTSQDAYAQALKKVRKEVSLPGFRKGRVPENVILDKYKKEILREYYDVATNDAIHEALTLTKIFPFNSNKQLQVKMIEELHPQNGGTISASYEYFPLVPKVDPSEVRVKSAKSQNITDHMINRHVNMLRVSNAALEEVSDRPAKEGDVVELTIANMEDLERTRNIPGIHLSKEFAEPEIYEAVVGLNVGDHADNVKPKDETNDDVPPVRVTLKSIKEGNLPEIDEQFLEKHGVKTEEELRTEIRKYYEREAEAEKRSALHLNIEEALVSTYDFDIPKSMFEHEKNRRFEDYLSQYSEDDAHNETKRKEISENAEKDAKETIRLQFLLSRIVNEQHIEVSEQEISSRLTSILMQNRQLLTQDFDIKPLYARIQNSLVLEKALDYLMDNVSYIED